LIRKIFADIPLDTFFAELNSSLADALLASHRSYYSVLRPILSEIKALAHITGGGFIENLPRILPESLDANIQLNSWPASPLWDFIQQTGEIDTEEMYRVFNMGIGMILIADKDTVSKIQNLIPETTFVIGELADGHKKVQLVK
jgi:phosphoribosylaminoimidazole (AIR) synthetase